MLIANDTFKLFIIEYRLILLATVEWKKEIDLFIGHFFVAFLYCVLYVNKSILVDISKANN